jgi:Domain of unknown function (DUF5668)
MCRILGAWDYDARMSDQDTRRPPDPTSEPTSEPTSDPSAEPGAEPSREPSPEPRRTLTLEERFERFGQEAERAGERLGREAEDAGRRIAGNPVVAQAADTAARVWGLLLIGVGAWFFAEFTLGYDLPDIPWRDVWPLGLIVIGLAVILRGLSRGSA